MSKAGFSTLTHWAWDSHTQNQINKLGYGRVKEVLAMLPPITTMLDDLRSKVKTMQRFLCTFDQTFCSYHQSLSLVWLSLFILNVHLTSTDSFRLNMSLILLIDPLCHLCFPHKSICPFTSLRWAEGGMTARDPAADQMRVCSCDQTRVGGGLVAGVWHGDGLELPDKTSQVQN